jgi:hypothetical protein
MRLSPALRALLPFIPLIVMVFLPLLGFAATTAGTDGSAAVGMSRRLICYTFSTIQGNIGLLAGFAIGLYGLWTIIRGSPGFGLFLIVAGALTTALPSLISSGLAGLQSVVENSGLSSSGNVNDVGTALKGIQGYGSDCDAISVSMAAYQQVAMPSVLNPNGQATSVPGTVLDDGSNYNTNPSGLNQYDPLYGFENTGAGNGSFGSLMGGRTFSGDLPSGFTNACGGSANCDTIWQSANNPGNIRPCGTNCLLPGQAVDANGNPAYINTVNGQFAVFNDMQSGLNQIGAQLDRYSSRGNDTIGGQITTYAPPSENNTAAYIQSAVNYVNQTTGSNLTANSSVSGMTAAQKSAYVSAITKVETGHTITGN